MHSCIATNSSNGKLTQVSNFRIRRFETRVALFANILPFGRHTLGAETSLMSIQHNACLYSHHIGSNLLKPMAEQTCDTCQRFSLKLWIAKNFGWSWFTCTQSTGGVAILLCQCPKQFEGLHEIGLTIFLVNLLLFTLFNALLIGTWVTDSSNIKKSFTKAGIIFSYVASLYTTRNRHVMTSRKRRGSTN